MCIMIIRCFIRNFTKTKLFFKSYIQSMMCSNDLSVENINRFKYEDPSPFKGKKRRSINLSYKPANSTIVTMKLPFLSLQILEQKLVLSREIITRKFTKIKQQMSNLNLVNLELIDQHYQSNKLLISNLFISLQ